MPCKGEDGDFLFMRSGYPFECSLGFSISSLVFGNGIKQTCKALNADQSEKRWNQADQC